MDRRTFMTGATLGLASTALPFTANLARSAPAGPLVHHHRATAFRPFDELAEHYAPALRNLTPEQAVRRLYRGMLGISMPLPKGVDICVQYWERQGAEGPAMTLRWFMQHPAFRFAKPRDGRGYVVSGVSKEIADALTRWKQTDILYRTLWNRPPTVAEATETLLSVAELVPMGATKTVILPGQRQSWITHSTAHAEMDYYTIEYVATPWGAVDSQVYNQLKAELIAHGVPSQYAHSMTWAVAGAAASAGSDIGVTMGGVAAGLNAGDIGTTMAVGAGVGAVTLGTGLGIAGLATGSTVLTLTGIGLVALGVAVIIVVLVPMNPAAGAPAGSASVGTPPNGPSQTPQGTVTVGDFVSVTIGETTDATGPTGVGDVGNSGAGGTDGSDGAPE